VKQLIRLVNHVYWRPLEVLETRVLKAVPLTREWLSRLGDTLVITLISKMNILITLVITTLMPRLSVGVLLMIDILVYGQVAMMYKAIVLLIIPILFNTMIGMIKHNAAGIKTVIEETMLIITYKDNIPYVQSRDTDIALLNYENNKSNWIKAYNVLDTTNAIEILKHSPVMLYLRILTVSLFLLSWTVYLLVIIKYLYFKYLIYKFIRQRTRLSRYDKKTH
jgi:hypothetical protein